MVKLLISLMMCLLAISQVAALRCWRCSSDIQNGDFCRDPFNPSAMTESQRKWNYVDCALPPTGINPSLLDRARPVCKRSIQEINDKLVFARGCTWELEGTASDACKYTTSSPPNIKMLYCETCKTDGCNGDMERSMPNNDKTTPAPTSGAVTGFLINRCTLLVAGLVAMVYGY